MFNADENGKLSEQEFLNLLAIKETVYKKEVGVVEDMLEDIFQATIVGLVIEGVYGKELMTKDRLSSDECSDKYKDAAIRAVTLDWGFAATGGKQAVKRIAGSMLEDVTASTGSVLVRHMNIPGKLGIACEFLTGCGISKRVGELVRNPFRKRFEFVTADGWIIEDVPIRDINPRNIKKIEKELDIAGDLKEEARRLTGVDNAGKIKIGKTVEGGSKGATQAAEKVKYGEHFTKVDRKKVLKPNVSYETVEGYKYKTNDVGAITEVEGTLKLGEGNRNLYAQRIAGGDYRLPDDDGGHLIASQFLGSGELDNLVPMNSQINRSGGKWYNMEQEWANALKEGKEVKVKIEPIYDSDNLRPVSFKVKYNIDGQRTKIIKILNQAGG